MLADDRRKQATAQAQREAKQAAKAAAREAAFEPPPAAPKVSPMGRAQRLGLRLIACGRQPAAGPEPPTLVQASKPAAEEPAGDAKAAAAKLKQKLKAGGPRAERLWDAPGSSDVPGRLQARRPRLQSDRLRPRPGTWHERCRCLVQQLVYVGRERRTAAGRARSRASGAAGV